MDDIQHFLLTRPRGMDMNSPSTVRTARKRAGRRHRDRCQDAPRRRVHGSSQRGRQRGDCAGRVCS